MKKVTKWIIYIISGIALIVFFIAVAGMYKFNYLANQPGYDVDGNKINIDTQEIDEGEFIKVPDFKIVVNLSKSAQDKLLELGEVIKVIAYFDGDGNKLVGEKTAPFRAVYMGSVERNIQYGEVAIFKDVKLSKKDFDRLFSKNYYVTINVVSGREKYKDNLLDTTVYSELINFFANKEIVINGKLIGE